MYKAWLTFSWQNCLCLFRCY